MSQQLVYQAKVDPANGATGRPIECPNGRSG